MVIDLAQFIVPRLAIAIAILAIASYALSDDRRSFIWNYSLSTCVALGTTAGAVLGIVLLSSR
jgi:hypothetical protein